MGEGALGSSYRDPSGFVFQHRDNLYRQINQRYRKDYRQLMDSGLYDSLVDSKLLVAHREVDLNLAPAQSAYRVVQPELIPFISYPYEWCFAQLQQAALLTLEIQERALEANMSLKDASAYNIQFVGSNPVLIDTLSFESYQEGEPWVAYRQFCEHFVAPLALMAYRDVRTSQLLRAYIDGIPLDLAQQLLGVRTWRSMRLLLHINLHAKSQSRFANQKKTNRAQFKKRSFLGLLDSLKSTVSKLKLSTKASSWQHYYAETNYTEEAMEQKRQAIEAFLKKNPAQGCVGSGCQRGLV